MWYVKGDLASLERIFRKGLKSSDQSSSTESIMDLDDCYLEPFSGYIFPAVHELQSYACAKTEDCGGKENVECADVMDRSNQKVCKCTEDAYLDVQSKTCGKEHHATPSIQLANKIFHVSHYSSQATLPTGMQRRSKS